MSVYQFSIPAVKQMLKNIDGWLQAASEHAQKKSFDANVLVNARLAPDQFAFGRQVQAACDAAKFIASRLTGKEAPKHPDTEQTIDELRKRVAAVLDYLEGFKSSDFDGAETRKVTLSFMEGMYLSGVDYLTQMALPNFYFHATTAYAILRHNGVDLGKQNFIGALSMHEV